MIITVVVLIATVVMFITGKIRADIVALCALTILILCGILSPAEALAGFSNQVVVMMVGLFVVGGAILQTGLAKAASGRIMQLAGNNDTAMFLLVVIVTALIGAFVSNTGTVALMMPIIVSMAMESKKSASRLLMPLAFASSMGGMLTLIGTPPNLVIDETLRAASYEGLSFFSFLPVGIICLVVGVVVMLPLSKLLVKTSDKGGVERREKTLEKLVEEYRLNNNVEAFSVGGRSSIVGKTVAQLNLRAEHNISIMEIRSETSRHRGLIKNITQSLPTQESVIAADDILYLHGPKEEIERFASAAGLIRHNASTIDFYDIGIAEIVVMPESRLVGQLLRQSRLREQYQVNVLGVKRSREYITENLPDVKLRAGDTLLVQGRWENISKIDTEEEDWLLIGQPKEMAERVALTYKAPLAAIIMLAMIAVMVFDFIPIAPVTAVIAAGLLMVVTGCFRSVDAAYKTINWESIVLIAAMIPMATALE